MSNAIQTLQELQARMHHEGFHEGWPELTERLFFTQAHGFWFVEYFGNRNEFFGELLKVLIHPDIAGTLRWLSLRGLDEGANGTKPWDFTPFLETEVYFPCLQSLQITRTPPENHNHNIVGVSYEEEGQLGSLLDRMPALIELFTPSAPDVTFCKRPSHPLRLLYMDCGYNHQNFIENLAQSTCFPELKIFDFSDYCQFYMTDWKENTVPFDQYKKLFQSQTLPALHTFFLRNSHMTEVEVSMLQVLAPKINFAQQKPRIF
jgi:hypothetical protein